MSVYSEAKRLRYFSRSGSVRGVKKASTEVVRNMELLQTLHEKSSDNLRYREKEEQRDFGTVGAMISFDQDDVSPYMYPLDGDTYESTPSFGPDGMCPLCNNERAAELDSFYVSNLHNKRAWRAYPFSDMVVAEHVIRHIGLIYSSAASEIAEVKEGLRNGGYTKVLEGANARKSEMLLTISRRIDVELSRARSLASRIRAEHKETVILDPDPGYIPSGQPADPCGSYVGRPAKGKAKKWYAYNGTEKIGALRPWGDRRMANEIEKKTNSAVVFYDEMLDARSMYLRIYGEIMDSDIDTANEEAEQRADKRNQQPKYIERNYAAAIRAVDGYKSVALDMAKFALIAMKYGDSKDSVKKLSPAMSAMMDELGIFEQEPHDVTEAMAEEVDG